MTYPYPTLNRRGNGGAERVRDFLGVTWSARTRHGQHRVSSPPVGGSVEGGRMLSSHSLSSRTLEGSGGGALCFKRFWLVRWTNELRPRHRQIPGVNGLGQPSAGNSRREHWLEASRARSFQEDSKARTEFLRPGPCSSTTRKPQCPRPQPTGAAEQAFQDALALLLLRPFL